MKPLTTAGMAAAQAAARRAVETIERQGRERTEAGLVLEGLPDLSAEGERDGFYQAQLIRELAVRHITSWTGVKLAGGPASPTPENIAAVMKLYPVGERFFQEFTLRQVLLNAAKNGSGLSAAGISSRAEGPNTAEPAATTPSPAPEASPEPTDGSAYREHALISRQEHEAWYVSAGVPGAAAARTEWTCVRHPHERNAEDRRRSGLQYRGPLGAAAGCGGGVGRGVVRRPRSRIIAPTLTTGAYRTRRIAAGHR
jgi:hypothetical protein